MCVQDNEDGMEGEQAEEEPAPETRIEVEIPKVSTDLGSDLYFVKLPNFLSVEPRSEPWPCQYLQYKHMLYLMNYNRVIQL